MLLRCLSVRQPYAELIMSGAKRVENRSRTYLKDRDWHREGPLLLGIHASRQRAPLTEEELDEIMPRRRDGAAMRGGVVLGVVDVLSICRPADLPAELRRHRHVNHDADNWCWVLGNPRRLTKPVEASGQAWLFNVRVPNGRLPAGVRP
jgi:hypothetical protein